MYVCKYIQLCVMRMLSDREYERHCYTAKVKTMMNHVVGEDILYNIEENALIVSTHFNVTEDTSWIIICFDNSLTNRP